MTEIIVALIGAFALVLTALIPILWLRANMGRKNGKGTVTEMLELVVENQVRHDIKDTYRFGRIEQIMGLPPIEEAEPDLGKVLGWLASTRSPSGGPSAEQLLLPAHELAEQLAGRS